MERLFGTVELDIFKLLPGYTGGRPGELPGYDAMANGVLTVEQLHEIVTRYFVDEYPSNRHYGVGMGGRRPRDVYETINETRGQIPPIDPHDRRIHLGWEQEVTPTDEGVRLFQGIWFNSTELQTKRDEYKVKGKVKVFVDPDNMNFATVVLPKVKEPVEVQLQMTAFADMTLPEILRLMAEQRREDPEAAAFHEDRVMRTRKQRYDQITAIGVEHNLPRSYSTLAECKAMAKAVLAGPRVIPSQPIPGTTRPEAITDLQPSEGVYRIGDEEAPIEGTAEMGDPVGTPGETTLNDSETGSPATSESTNSQRNTGSPSPNARSLGKPSTSHGILPRPKNLKGLE